MRKKRSLPSGNAPLALREQIRLLERQVEDLRSDRDKWQQQAAQITRLLTDERSESERSRAEVQRLETVKATQPSDTPSKSLGIRQFFWRRKGG
ncbi:MAG: hypothetical protein AB7F35_27455 [Acetobacteraceae bacterium]